MATFVVGTLASVHLGDSFQPVHRKDSEPDAMLGYVAEVVVHSAHTGRGIGSRLLEKVQLALHEVGVDVVYIKRHAETLASAGMMSKAGFQDIAVFADPLVRESGSRRNCISRFEFGA